MRVTGVVRGGGGRPSPPDHEDRHPVQDHTGAFSCEWGGGLLVQGRVEGGIDFLDHMVPADVEPVDLPFRVGDHRVIGRRVAARVFQIPLPQVGADEVADEQGPRRRRIPPAHHHTFHLGHDLGCARRHQPLVQLETRHLSPSPNARSGWSWRVTGSPAGS